MSKISRKKIVHKPISIDNISLKMESIKLNGERPFIFNEDFDLVHNSPIETLATRGEIKLNQQRLVVERAQPALNELLEAGKDFDPNQFFNKLNLLCVSLSGLGSPQNHAVVKETYTALNSVVKSCDVGRLMELSRPDKEHHLLELVQIVMGIRLFNKDCHKGGEDINDLPQLLTQAVVASKNQLAVCLKTFRNRCQRWTSALCSMYILDSSTDTTSRLLVVPEAAKDDCFIMKKALCGAWANILHLRRLKDELSESEEHVNSNVNQLRETLVQLHETVRCRAAIPTIQVYPLFVQLSLVWRELQYEAAVLSHMSRILKLLSSLPEPTNERLLDRKSSSQKGQISLEMETPKETLKFLGFCPWTIVQTEGVLLPGHCIVDGMAFRSPQCAAAWIADQVKSFHLLNGVLQNLPDIALLLGISRETAESNDSVKQVKTTDVEVQTEVHPIESCVDKDYVWSEWKLKYRAIKWARIAQCATSSQQTDVSYFRSSKKC